VDTYRHKLGAELRGRSVHDTGDAVEPWLRGLQPLPAPVSRRFDPEEEELLRILRSAIVGGVGGVELDAAKILREMQKVP
jgi:hypothetical protein